MTVRSIGTMTRRRRLPRQWMPEGPAMWIDDFRSFLCDLDGCLIAGDTVLAGARELLARAGERLWIVSNNSTETPATLAARLERLGLPVRPDRILLAGATAIEYL